jgi:DNA-binding transcriptional LysR family regulator|tara:strand:- start:979 stop:1221 length:243 start_codon:yes stop_codon:yes gene_type:complete
MNTNDAIIEAIEANWGLSQILSFQVAPFISEGRFRLVLEEYEQPAMPIHIVHQEGRMVSSKTRSFVDFAVEMLRQELGQN